MSSAFSWDRVIVLVLLVTTAAAQEMPKDQPPLWSAKPDIAAFEKMENDRLASAQRAIDQIVSAQGPKTIENTLVPYDEAIQQLNAAVNFSTLMQQVHPDSAYRDHATEMNTKVSGAQTALSLNRDVYRALAALDVSGADPATRYYVQRQLLEFHLAGVDKDDVTREKLKKLRDQLSEDQSTFGRNISDDVKVIEITDASELDGMPQDFIDSHKPGPDGKIHITADEPDAIIVDLAKSDDLRRRFFEARRSRAYPKNRDVLEDMMRICYEIATLLGYSSWADYSAADRMIGSGNNMEKFITQLDAAARPMAQREFDVLLAEKRKTKSEAVGIATYDYYRLAELVRRTKYDFDSSTVRPYMPYKQVKQGIMDTAATLFHVTFRQEKNVPAWDPSVETWDVIDNGKVIGRFYLDMHPRPGKHGHPEMAPVLDGIRGKQLPEAALVCSFPEPTADDPGLMEYEDVVNFFHEFGHLMHHILGGQQPWAGVSGITMEADFGEVPSQMLEEWMHSPQVLASFAHDYKTGKPIPADLVARMNRASAFGRAIDVGFQTAMSAASYNVYNGKPEKVDLEAIFPDAFRRYTLVAPVPADAHMYANFIYLSGYPYYVYLWDLAIAEDFFQQFDQHDLFAGDTPMRYRRLVLEPGGSMSANDLVNNFLGRPQSMTAFQKWIGEEFENPSQGKPASEH